jgi:glycosyltransferase involved in cell wall biosynthesis
MSGICRLFFVPSIFLIVDGWFFTIKEKSFIKRFYFYLLLKLPYYLVSSGSRWDELFSSLGVVPRKIMRVHYWLPNSFNVRKISKSPPISGVVNFLFVGWMVREKGVYEILSALSDLLSNYDLNFTFVGDGPELDNIRSIICKKGWESRVFALGRLSDAQKEIELDASHVFVLPSYAEGFPMSLIEALSVGMPAICSDVGGVSDSVLNGVNGFLVRPKSSDELRSAMEFYINNQSAISAHSLKSLEMAKKNHDPFTNCAKFLKVFSRCNF